MKILETIFFHLDEAEIANWGGDSGFRRHNLRTRSDRRSAKNQDLSYSLEPYTPEENLAKLSQEQLSTKYKINKRLYPASLNHAPNLDLVDFSVFCPPKVKPQKRFCIQTYFHLEEDMKDVRIEATSIDPDTSLKKTETLQCPVKWGSQLDIVLLEDSLEIDEFKQSLTWRGKSTSCTFVVRIASQNTEKLIIPRIIVLHRGQQLGQVKFTIRLDEDSQDIVPVLTGDKAQRFNLIFMSYARKDMIYVRQIARLFLYVEQDFFWDLLHISPKERWKKKLYNQIDKADAFYLFWSKAARDSQWVKKETDYALECYRKTGKPEIICYPLEGPPCPEPLWKNIQDYQCGDKIYNLTATARPKKSGWFKWFRRAT